MSPVHPGMAWAGRALGLEGEWSDQEAAGRGVQLEGSGRLSAALAVPPVPAVPAGWEPGCPEDTGVVRAPSQTSRASLKDTELLAGGPGCLAPDLCPLHPLGPPASVGWMPRRPTASPRPGPGSSPTTLFCLHRFVVSCTPSWFWGPVVTLEDCLAAFFAADELKGEWTEPAGVGLLGPLTVSDPALPARLPCGPNVPQVATSALRGSPAFLLLPIRWARMRSCFNFSCPRLSMSLNIFFRTHVGY